MGEIISKLNRNKLLSNRTRENSDLKLGIAQLFIRDKLRKLLAKDYRKFFFESGSSTAFVAKEFVDYYSENHDRNLTSTCKDLQIETNNVLANIYFRLNQEMDKLCMYPQGIPRDEYGATYGQLENFMGHEWPRDVPVDFSISEFLNKDININIKDQLTGITDKFNENYVDSTKPWKGMIFMAASGVGRNTDKFQGPHVHSFINMLFSLIE